MCWKCGRLYAKIYFALEFKQDFFKKICWISFITGCGGYILIKSDFKLLNTWSFQERYCLFPTRVFPLTHKVASQPPPQIPCWNWFPQKISGYVTGFSHVLRRYRKRSMTWNVLMAIFPLTFFLNKFKFNSLMMVVLII